MIYDVIILGAGGMGSAAAFHLARRGLKVLALEQFALGHALGSSHGETRIIRQAYFEHPDYVPLLRRAYVLWDELAREVDLQLYRETGLLLSGTIDGEAVPGAQRAARQHEIPLLTLERQDVADRYPGLCLPESHTVLLEPHAGFLAVEACVTAHQTMARRHGAVFRAEMRVTGIDWSGQGVVVRTKHESFSASHLVVTAGAWTGQLLPELSAILKPSRKVVGWYGVPNNFYQMADGFPCYYIEDGRQACYGFPSLDGSTMKVAEHTGFDPVTDPSRVDRACHPADTHALNAFVKTVFPRAVLPLQRHSVCMYTMSPDGHFILDRSADRPLTYACGFSGHGFKFASVIGEILADLATTGRTAHPVDFLRAGRLAESLLPPSEDPASR